MKVFLPDTRNHIFNQDPHACFPNYLLHKKTTIYSISYMNDDC